MKRTLILWLASLAVWLSGNALAVEPTTDSLDKVKQNLAEKKAVLLDVREQSEWDAGHLQQAMLIPYSQFKKGAEDADLKARLAKEVPKDKIVYTHCAVGVRALIAGNVLEKLGYDVRPLQSSFDELTKSLPVAK